MAILNDAVKNSKRRVGNAHNIRVLVGNAHPTYMFKNQIGVL